MPSYQFEGHSVAGAPKKSSYSKNENHSHSANYSRYYQNPTAKSCPVYSGYEYPDGTYSLGRVSEKKTKADKQYDSDINYIYETVEWSEPNPAKYLGYGDCVASRLLDDRVARIFRESGQNGNNSNFDCHSFKVISINTKHPYSETVPWDLVPKLDPPQELSQDTAKTKKRYGQNGITREGKRKVKSGATLLERKYGVRRLGLCTVTLPSESAGLDSADLYYLSRYWSEFKRRFLQEFKRELERKGAPTVAIAVTEFQEKRYEKYGEPAPHLHILHVCREKEVGSCNYYLEPQALRRILQRLLMGMLDRQSHEPEINCNSAINMQRVRQSASGYLAKYMSKGEGIVGKLKEDGLEDCIPNQWWSPIGGMRDWVKVNIRKISSDIASFLATAKQGDDGIKYVKQISTVIGEGKELVVGIYVRVTKEMFEFLSGINWKEPISY